MTTKLVSRNFTAVLVARRSQLLLHRDRARLYAAGRHRIWRCHRDAFARARAAYEDTCTGMVGAQCSRWDRYPPARLRQDRLDPPDAADARLSARHCARACLLQAARFANAHARAWAIGSALRRLFIAGHDAAAAR